jgi:hypothetical protein
MALRARAGPDSEARGESFRSGGRRSNPGTEEISVPFFRFGFFFGEATTFLSQLPPAVCFSFELSVDDRADKAVDTGAADAGPFSLIGPAVADVGDVSGQRRRRLAENRRFSAILVAQPAPPDLPVELVSILGFRQ